ncbi:HAT family dimerization protein [Rhizoctonia solani 123E]|uniref:HAT family dimerization protein n=1 Tax=Rhizoctonia solani 123E TaxID=1423351 RepID=A0A074RQL4_9AGAM|nr:HAT family dimerization protein [Rhizoctonia solani 123E]
MPSSVAEKLQPFIFFSPAHPVDLTQGSLLDHSRQDIARLAAKATGSTDRVAADAPIRYAKRVPDGEDNAAAKRQKVSAASNLPPALPPTTHTIHLNSDTRPSSVLRSAAADCWNGVIPCNLLTPPENVSLEDVIASDKEYQQSKPLHAHRRPPIEEATRLRCADCLEDFGEWHTWVNRKGGLTNRIREHNLKRHREKYLARCREAGIHPPGVDTQIPNDDDSDTEFTPELLARRIAQFVAINDEAFRMVDIPEFRSLLLLCARAPQLQSKDIPHRSKLTKTMKELYGEKLDEMRVELNKALGHISVTSDLWSDERLRAFMAVTFHYINKDGYLSEHLFAFRRIQGRHTGANVGKALFKVFEEAGIVHKIGHITLDNASNNNTLMAGLEEAFASEGHSFGRELNRIRCFPHIINLAAQSIQDALGDAARLFEDEVLAKGDALDEDTHAYLNALKSFPIDLCRDSIRALRSSDLRREGFHNLIQEGNFHSLFRTHEGTVLLLPVLELLRDCETRWSSTYFMILRYLLLYPAVALFAHRNPELRIPTLTHKQYEVLQDICSILSILNQAQELLSAEKTPTLALALPVYEALIQALDECTIKFPELAHAILRGKLKLEGYVTKARDLPVYALAIVANPCLRFRWIRSHMTSSRAQTIKVTVMEAMLQIRQRLHKETSIVPSNSMRHEPRNAALAQGRGYLRLLQLSAGVNRASELTGAESRQSHTDVPLVEPLPPLSDAELLARHMADVEAELLRWEQFEWSGEDSMGSVDLVEFWRVHKHEFPLLYWIAMDVLPVQASSVSSERAFSSSKLTCTRERTKLSPENIEYLQVLKHSLHRRRITGDNRQTLDFMSHIVYPDNHDDFE